MKKILLIDALNKFDIVDQFNKIYQLAPFPHNFESRQPVLSFSDANIILLHVDENLQLVPHLPGVAHEIFVDVVLGQHLRSPQFILQFKFSLHSNLYLISITVHFPNKIARVSQSINLF